MGLTSLDMREQTSPIIIRSQHDTAVENTFNFRNLEKKDQKNFDNNCKFLQSHKRYFRIIAIKNFRLCAPYR